MTDESNGTITVIIPCRESNRIIPDDSIIAELTCSVEADSDQMFMKMIHTTQNENLVL
jgi:hypothetical protein